MIVKQVPYVTATFIASSEGTTFKQCNAYHYGLNILVLIIRSPANGI